jgi:uncharacterized repeat protein (TIGR01451 family)
MSSTKFNNQAQCTTQIQSPPDLTISKTGPSAILVNNPAEEFAYVITLFNNGPTTASNVGVFDNTIPSVFAVNTGAITITASDGRIFSFATSCTGALLNCNFGTLAPGQNISIVLPFTVSAGAPEGTVRNCANVTAALDSNWNNNRACQNTTISTGVNVFIQKSGNDVCAGGRGSFLLEIGNTGPSTARNVFVADQLDQRVTGVTAVISPVAVGASCNVNATNWIRCDFPDLAALPSIQFRVVISFNVPSSLVPSAVLSPLLFIDNTARIFTSSFEKPADIPNDSSSATIFFNPCVDVYILKTGTSTAVAGRNSNAAGVPYTYTVTVGNNGPSDAISVVVTDTMPIGFTPIGVPSVASGQGSCTTPLLNINGQYFFTCSWPGQTFSTTRVEIINLAYSVNSDVLPGIYINYANVAAPFDKNETNNNAQWPVRVDVLAPLTILKEGPHDCVVAGERVNQNGSGAYTITITNNGPSRARSVTLVDSMPAPYPMVLSSAITIDQTGAIAGTRMCSLLTVGSQNPSFSCDLFALDPGQSIRVTYSLQVPASQGGPVTAVNTATASAVQGCTFAQATSCPITPVTTTFNTSICATADLAIFKNEAAPGVEYVAGSNTLYAFQIIVVNNGPSVSYNVKVQDFDFTAGDITLSGVGWTCTGLVCTTSELLVGVANQKTLTASFVIPGTKPCGPYTNYVNVTSLVTTDPDLSNNKASSTIAVIAKHSVTIAKTGTQQFVAGGDAGSHFVTIVNQGPSTATNVVVTDQVPFQLPVVSGSVNCGGGTSTGSGQFISCSYGNLNKDETRTITYSIKVGAAGQTGLFTNNAQVTTGAARSSCEIEALSGLAHLDNTVTCRDSITLKKTDNTAEILAGTGAIYVYTITVHNDGPSVARSVFVQDRWLTQLTRSGPPTSSNPDKQCPFVAPFISCTWDLEVNETVVIQQAFYVEASVPPQTVINTVTAKSTCANSETVTAFDTTRIINQADLAITKDDCSPTIVAGSSIPNVFTFTVTNYGPSDGVNVTVTDFVLLPYHVVNLETNSIEIPGRESSSPKCRWDLLAGGQLLTCVFEFFPANRSTTFTLAVTVPSDTPKSWVHNCARVSNGGIPDPDPLNNEDCDLNEVCTIADVAVTKVLNTPVSPDCGVENGIVAGNTQVSQYVVSVVNNGPSTARTVSFDEQFPAGVTIKSSPSGCTSLGGNKYHCVLPGNGDLLIGTTVTFPFTFTIAPDTPKGLITNFVSVKSVTVDPDLCNNNFTLASPVCVVSDLSITKTDGVSQVTAGDGVTYKYIISGTNFGPSDAAMVVVNDVWPLFAASSDGTTGGFNIVKVEGASCSNTASGLLCNVGNVTVGSSYTFCIWYTLFFFFFLCFVCLFVFLQVYSDRYQVDACLQACTMCNLASVSSMSVEPNLDGHSNIASDCNDVRTEADLEICKSDGVDKVVAGDDIIYTYTIQVEKNYGKIYLFIYFFSICFFFKKRKGCQQGTFLCSQRCPCGPLPAGYPAG